MSRVLLYGLVVVVSPLVSILLLHSGFFIVVALLLVVAVVLLMIFWPEAATLIFIFALYLNLPVVAVKFYGVPFLLGSSVTLILGFPLMYYLLIRKEGLILDQSFGLMILFLISQLMSTLVAVSKAVAFDEIVVFLTEGLLLYFLVSNSIRTMATLKRCIWMLMLSGAFMGGLTLVSELTGSYDSDFGGLVQRIRENEDFVDESDQSGLLRTRESLDLTHRSAGPVGQPNRFAQVLLVLFPLGLILYFNERTQTGKIIPLLMLLLTLSGFLLTYSRGAFLIFGFLCLLLVLLGYVRASHAILAGVVLLVLTLIVAPGYLERIGSIGAATALFDKSSNVEADGAITGRATEMLAALYVFLDYPIVGVGPGQYMPYYSEDYQANPDISFRDIGRMRRAHTLYFELAAETGLVGLLIFLAIPGFQLLRLWRIRQASLGHRPELVHFATGLGLCLVAYLTSAVFEHMAYQRYYWLLIAVVGSALPILEHEIASSSTSSYKTTLTP